MKTVDFKQLVIKNITDNTLTQENIKEICEILGNSIFNHAYDISLNELGRKIYHQEKVEISQEQITAIKEIMNNRKMCGLSGFVNVAMNKIFDEL